MSAWICEHCGTLMGPADPGRCVTCGGPTRLADFGYPGMSSAAVTIDSPSCLSPSLAETILLRLAAIEAHAESTADMARALKHIVAMLAGGENLSARSADNGTDGQPRSSESVGRTDRKPS